jgi:hypothetical protein
MEFNLISDEGKWEGLPSNLEKPNEHFTCYNANANNGLHNTLAAYQQLKNCLTYNYGGAPEGSAEAYSAHMDEGTKLACLHLIEMIETAYNVKRE